jgi:preprotein translocase subunit SecE
MNQYLTIGSSDFSPVFLAATGGSDYVTIGIWAGVVAVIFAILWFTGNLVKLRNYVLETREELRKCTWPSVEELKGSTVVVMISIFVLGVFTYVIDQAVFWFVAWMVQV